MIKCLTANEFASAFDTEVQFLPEQCLSTINTVNLNYEEILGSEREACILEILKVLESAELSVAGSGVEKWEKGWRENLDDYLTSGEIDVLTPKYFKNKIFRFNGNYIKTESSKFELDLYRIIRQILFHKYLAESSSIIEFGCGTGTSLIMLSEMYPEKRLIGCDWATSSQQIIEAIAQKTGKNIVGINFDMFSPHENVPVSEGSAVITMHAMEQLGTNYHAFLNYLLSKRPSICVHLEPIVELYEENSLFDFVAVRYHFKRGYLSGFLKYLQDIEAANEIQLIDVRRLFLGGFFHEAYSVVVWKPL